MSESGDFKKKLEMFSKNLPENQHNIGRKKTVPERKVKEVGTASEDKLKENVGFSSSLENSYLNSLTTCSSSNNTSKKNSNADELIEKNKNITISLEEKIYKQKEMNITVKFEEKKEKINDKTENILVKFEEKKEKINDKTENILTKFEDKKEKINDKTENISVKFEDKKETINDKTDNILVKFEDKKEIINDKIENNNLKIDDKKEEKVNYKIENITLKLDEKKEEKTNDNIEKLRTNSNIKILTNETIIEKEINIHKQSNISDLNNLSNKSHNNSSLESDKIYSTINDKNSIIPSSKQKNKPDKTEDDVKNTHSDINLTLVSLSSNINSIPNLPQKLGPSIPSIPSVIPLISKSIASIPNKIVLPPIPGGKPGVPNGIPIIPGMISSTVQLPKLKPKEKVRTVQTMKPFYWIPIEPRKLYNTLWEKLDDSQITINAIKFEEEFSQKKKESEKEKAHMPMTQSNLIKPSMLIPARQQNITIVLSKLKLHPINIAEALLSYDEKILTPEVCEMLIQIIPSEAEIHLVDSFDGEPMSLADSDQFVLLMATAPGFEHRLRSLVFKNTYKTEIQEINRRVNQFIKALDYVLTDIKFHKWLEIILAYGNYLNGMTNRGGVYAFKLDTLTKLGEFKSNDNKKNLLYFIIEYIGDVLKSDELLDITKELEMFSELSMSAITDSYKELNSRYSSLNSLSEIIKKEEKLEDDGSIEFLNSLQDTAKLAMNTTDEKIKSIEEKYIKTIEFFGDNKKELPMETFIEIFIKFYKDLNVVKISYLRGRELKEKMEKKKIVNMK